MRLSWTSFCWCHTFFERIERCVHPIWYRTGMPRYLHPKELATLLAIPLSVQFQGPPRSMLALLGLVASPMQSVWVFAHIIKAASSAFPDLKFLDPEMVLCRYKKELLRQVHEDFPFASPPKILSLSLFHRDGPAIQLMSKATNTVANLIQAESISLDWAERVSICKGSTTSPALGSMMLTDDDAIYVEHKHKRQCLEKPHGLLMVVLNHREQSMVSFIQPGTFLFQVLWEHSLDTNILLTDVRGKIFGPDYKIWGSMVFDVLHQDRFPTILAPLRVQQCAAPVDRHDQAGGSSVGLDDNAVWQAMLDLQDSFPCHLISPGDAMKAVSSLDFSGIPLLDFEDGADLFVIFASQSHWGLLQGHLTGHGLKWTYFDGLAHPLRQEAFILARHLSGHFGFGFVAPELMTIIPQDGDTTCGTIAIAHMALGEPSPLRWLIDCMDFFAAATRRHPGLLPMALGVMILKPPWPLFWRQKGSPQKMLLAELKQPLPSLVKLRCNRPFVRPILGRHLKPWPPNQAMDFNLSRRQNFKLSSTRKLPQNMVPSPARRRQRNPTRGKDNLNGRLIQSSSRLTHNTLRTSMVTTSPKLTLTWAGHLLCGWGNAIPVGTQEHQCWSLGTADHGRDPGTGKGQCHDLYSSVPRHFCSHRWSFAHSRMPVATWRYGDQENPTEGCHWFDGHDWDFCGQGPNIPGRTYCRMGTHCCFPHQMSGPDGSDPQTLCWHQMQSQMWTFSRLGGGWTWQCYPWSMGPPIPDHGRETMPSGSCRDLHGLSSIGWRSPRSTDAGSGWWSVHGTTFLMFQSIRWGLCSHLVTRDGTWWGNPQTQIVFVWFEPCAHEATIWDPCCLRAWSSDTQSTQTRWCVSESFGLSHLSTSSTASWHSTCPGQ